MNLFFRLIKLIIGNLLSRRPIGYLDESVLKFRVWITDQDAFQHMNNSRYISIADLAVIDILMRNGQAAGMRKAGLMPIVVHKHVSLFKMLRFPQAYEMRSRITGWEGPFVFFRHDFVRNEILHARAVTVGRLVGTKGQKPTVAEAAILANWDDIPESPPLTDEDRHALQILESQRQERQAARDAAGSSEP